MQGHAIQVRGFTMIEISIVLVIIGLLIGGVLLGRDLMDAARIRSNISQYDKFTAAASTFRLRYGYIPGDMPYNLASQNGLFAFSGASAGTLGYGDGSGQLEGDCVGEALVFFRHLSEAQLIEGSFGISGNSAIVPTTGFVTADVTDVASSIPPAKIGNGNYWCAEGNYTWPGIGKKNYLQIKGYTSITAAGGSTRTHNITPVQAHAMDNKVDDGMPLSGLVQSDNGAGACLVGSAYNISGSAGSTMQCKMYWISNVF